MKFKVGDKVILNKNIRDFKYSRGFVGYDEMGTIKRIDEYQEIRVDFPSCDDWRGLEKELILVSSNNKKTFFKKLPNNYTGTIEVENGYIIEKEILDKEEKEYLSAVIRPFRNRVEYIQKKDIMNEFIEIELDNEFFNLPDFEKDTMYKGMELNKKYTLKELDLDE
jgi:hypothetical protein